MRTDRDIKAMVLRTMELKEEKAAIEHSIREKECEVITELMNQGMSDYLTINWTRLKRMQ